MDAGVPSRRRIPFEEEISPKTKFIIENLAYYKWEGMLMGFEFNWTVSLGLEFGDDSGSAWELQSPWKSISDEARAHK